MGLRVRFREVADEIKREASEALLETGKDIFEVSQQLVPVDTGALKQSGGVVPESSTRVVVGYGKDYSVFQEYGSVHSPAQPFLTPAFTQAKETFEVRLRQRLVRIK